MLRWRAVFAFPPHVAVIGQRDVGVKRIVLDRFHRVRVRFIIRAGHHAEITVLRIDREQAAIADLHPGNVIADGGHFPAGKMFWWNEHGEICFAARARKRRRHIMFFSFRRLDPEDQHVLGHPTLFAREIGTDPERETLLTQQNVSAVTGAHRNDGIVLRKMADEAARGIDI